jgi:hypothetical protein
MQRNVSTYITSLVVASTLNQLSASYPLGFIGYCHFKDTTISDIRMREGFWVHPNNNGCILIFL